MNDNDTIPLDPGEGLDPRLTYCPRCHGEGKGIAIGAIRKLIGPGGEVAYAQRDKVAQVRKAMYEKLQTNPQQIKVEKLGEFEKVPDSEPCDKCQQELQEFDEIVKAGGVYWNCVTCHLSGVIKASQFAESVRESAGVAPPNPVGVQFESCQQHEDLLGGNTEKDQGE